MLKEANVKIDGLTVIAGENDTGKSTVGKALFSMIKATQSITEIDDDRDETKKILNRNFCAFYYLLFKSTRLPENGYIHLKKDKYFSAIKRKITEHNIALKRDVKLTNKITFIETPLVWNFSKFFRDIALVESQMDIKVDYPVLMKELNFKLFIKNASDGINIVDEMILLMGGKFEQDERGDYFFNKKGKRIELENIATGIKTFGIFQVLSQNNYLNENTVLVLDEPEVHLHPKWQLEMAKIIVELVKSGVKILVNSHSPYMIDALKYYSDKSKVNSNFYIAEKNKDETSTISDVTMDISPIFEKLTEPLERLHKMKLGLLDED